MTIIDDNCKDIINEYAKIIIEQKDNYNKLYSFIRSVKDDLFEIKDDKVYKFNNENEAFDYLMKKSMMIINNNWFEGRYSNIDIILEKLIDNIITDDVDDYYKFYTIIYSYYSSSMLRREEFIRHYISKYGITPKIFRGFMLNLLPIIKTDAKLEKLLNKIGSCKAIYDREEINKLVVNKMLSYGLNAEVINNKEKE